MADLSGALSQMTVMVLIAALGFAAAKAKVVTQDMLPGLSRMMINVTLPCMVLASLSSMGEGGGLQVAQAFVLAVLQFALLMGTAWLCNLALRTPKDERTLYLFMAVCTNTGFIGLPVLQAIYGDGSVIISSVFIMVLSAFIYSVGFGMLAKQSGRTSGGFPWKQVFNPAMLASVATIVLYLLDLRLPSLLNTALSMAGAITAPLAMIVVGVIVAGSSLKGTLGEWRLYPFILVRQLIAPALLFFALRGFGADPLVTGVFVVMFSMPVGSMASSFSESMGCDPRLPAKGTVLSTLASFAIIPLLVAMMTLSPL